MTSFLKEHILSFVLLLVGVSATVSILAVTIRFNEATRLGEELSRDVVAKRLEHFFSTMNDFPGSAGKDILFLRSLSSVQNLHNTTERVISADVYRDFKNVLDKNSAYKDMLFYRKSFGCVMRVHDEDTSGTALCESPTPAIADILKKAEPLLMDEIYISPPMSYRDIFPSVDNVPVIIYVTPVNTDCSIISIIDANYFLEEARRLSREGEVVFLLDKDGAYLANQDQSKEKFTDTAGNFYRDFPSVPDGALVDTDMRFLETPKENITFWRIYPTESNFAIYEGSNKILGEGHPNEYFWVMAIVSESRHAVFWWKDMTYLVSFFVVVSVHTLVAWFVLLITRVREENNPII